MERLEGADLGEHVTRGPLPIQLAVDCILQAAEALAEAHAAGIVHRDIKPSNLWLSHRSDGSPLLKVLDFGISKLAPTEGSDDPKLTETQAVFGSPTYMSPEQIRSAKKVDSSTDVWALGVVLHELLTARLPFEGESVAAVLASVSADPPAPLLAARPDAPAELANAILRCLEKDRSRRISLKELAMRLRPLASMAGAVSADRIMNAGAPSASLLPPPPMPSSAPQAVAFGETDTALATTRLAPGTTRRRSMLIVTGAALVLAVLVVGGALAFRPRVRAISGDPALPSAADTTIPAASTTAPLTVASTMPSEAPRESSPPVGASSSTNAVPLATARKGRPAAGAASVRTPPAPEIPSAAPPASAPLPTKPAPLQSPTRN
jgi:serine/threonine-protein kinase